MKSKKIKNIELIIVVIVAVILAVVGAFFIVNSSGDSEAIEKKTAEVTGVEYKIEGGVVKYTGDADRGAEVIQYAEPEEDDLIAHIYIRGYGKITVRFFPEQAPLAVDNFVTHVKEGYYEGLSFHRIIDDFMIQGGDPEGTGMGGESIWSEDDENVPFEDEYSEYLMPVRGALCMANSGANTNGSQFFIVQTSSYHIEYVMALKNEGVDKDLVQYYKENGGAGWLYGAHTVFGQVIDGYDVLDEVAGVETDSNGLPVEDVIIEKIELDVY